MERLENPLRLRRYPGEQELQEHIAATVMPEVVTALGEQAVYAVEIGLAVAGILNEMANIENPFEARKVDSLRFLLEEDKQKVNSIIQINENTIINRGISTTIRLSRSSKIADQVYRRSRDAAHEANKIIDDFKGHVDILSARLDAAETVGESLKAMDITELENQILKLYEAADKVPSEKDLRIMESLQAKAKRFLDAKRGKGGGPISPFQFAVSKLGNEFERSEGSMGKFKSFARALRQLGKLSHERLMRLVDLEQAVWVEHTLSVLDEVKRDLRTRSEQATEEERPHFMATEDYLLQKGMRITELAKKYALSNDDDSAFAKRIGRLLQPTLAISEAEKQRQQELELAKDLSHSATEARDIIKGGRRLKTPKGMTNIAELYDNLSLLEDESDEAKLLSVEERGIILALVTQRFDQFKATIGQIGSQEPDEVRAIVERERPEVVSIIRNFDLDYICENLLILFEGGDRAFKLDGLLTAEQIEQIRQALLDHLGLNRQEQESSEPLTARGDLLPETSLYAELDWTVLPEGASELEKVARKIVELAQERAAKSGKPVTIDLERLNTLDQIKDLWGADKCFYARGTLSGRKTVNIDGEDRPDEYIILVLQTLNSDGSVKTEHAIAESPIAGHNALYVFRNDVSPFSWREVYSYPKKDARFLGARSIKHTHPEGQNLIDVMTERVGFLLAASSDEFYKIRFSGNQIKIPE